MCRMFKNKKVRVSAADLKEKTFFEQWRKWQKQPFEKLNHVAHNISVVVEVLSQKKKRMNKCKHAPFYGEIPNLLLDKDTSFGTPDNCK